MIDDEYKENQKEIAIKYAEKSSEREKIAQKATDVLINIINNKSNKETKQSRCEIIEGKTVKEYETSL